MRDCDIRASLRDFLASAHAEENALLLDELGLCDYEARVDLAVINGSLNGFEIKSDADTLERLPRQQVAYSRALETVTIVVGPKYAETIATHIPSWWGIIKAVSVNGSIELNTVRQAARNPSPDPVAIASFLWRDEALAILREIGADRGVTSKPRQKVWQRLSEKLPIEELSERVRNCLKARANWRSDAQRTSGDAKFVH